VLRLRAGSLTQTSIVHLGRGYQSHFGTRIHFGMSDFEQFSLDILWPNGKSQSFDSSQLNRMFQIIEGDAELHPI
jgi:hypothetical protein